MSWGEEFCAVCGSDYGRSHRHQVHAPAGVRVFLCDGCYQLTTDLVRSRGGTRWDAVGEMTRRVGRQLLGWSTPAETRTREEGA